MKQSARKWLTAALAAGVSATILASGSALASTSVNKAARAAEPMSFQEVYSIYANKTWNWGNGAGYFPAKKRAFEAWSGSGRNASYGEGRWFATGNGNMCMKATWTSRDGSAPATTCFAHRKEGNTIYQRKLPDGDWYKFQSSSPRRSDEIRKLKTGDFVTNKVERIQRQIDRS